MRKKTRAALASTLWILVGMPVLDLVLRFIFKACGIDPPMILSIPNFIFLMIAMGGLSIYNITNAVEK